MKIDINSDMGEGFGVYQVCDDEALMGVVSSANIACGFHAGDPAIMTQMVRLAKARGVGIGAHPGLPDRQCFGRMEMPFSADALCQQVVYQFGALSAIARAEGTRVSHLSFHAAMGNMINRDASLAELVMHTLQKMAPELIIFCMADSVIEQAATKAGLPVLTLFLADRAYTDDGKLVPRQIAGSVITEEQQLRTRVRQFLKYQTVTTFSGETLPVNARSILIHSDTPGSLTLARIVRDEIIACGGKIAPAAEVIADHQ